MKSRHYYVLLLSTCVLGIIISCVYFLTNWIYKSFVTTAYIDSLRAPRGSTHIPVQISWQATDGTIIIPKDKAKSQPIYYSVKNDGDTPISYTLYPQNRNWTTTDNIISTIFQNKPSESDREKALALWHFLGENLTHSQIPNQTDIVSLLNGYGYGWCSDKAMALADIAKTVHLNSRIWHLYNNVVAEIFFDGSWHLLDPDQRVYFLNREGVIASVSELQTDRGLLENLQSDIKQSDSDRTRIIDTYETSLQTDPTPYDADSNNYDPNHHTTLQTTLYPGDEMDYFYHWPHLCANTYQHPDSFTNGLYTHSIPLILSNTEFTIELPYPMVSIYMLEQFPKDDYSWMVAQNDEMYEIISFTRLGDLEQINLADSGYHPIRKIRLKPLETHINLKVIVEFQISPISLAKYPTESLIITTDAPNHHDIKFSYTY